MINNSLKKKIKNLTIVEIQEKVKNIRSELPEHKRKIITYSRNFTLSLSNYCRNQCGYCYYNYKVPKKAGNKNIVLLAKEKIDELINKGIQQNCKEVLVMSGECPDEFLAVNQELKQRNHKNYVEYVKNICDNLLKVNLLPHMNIGLLDYDDMEYLKTSSASMGLMLESTSKRLFEKGMVHEKSPGKFPKLRINHIKNAGKLKIPFTTGLLLGIGENMDERIEDLYLIKRLNEDHGHIQEIIIQNFEWKEGIPYIPKKKISMEEMLKITGIAKILFKNEIAIQVPPNLIQGYEKDFIKIGVNDFGGISPFSFDYINPEKEWPSIRYLERICREIGYKLKERLPIYDKYLDDSNFCPINIKKVINKIRL